MSIHFKFKSAKEFDTVTFAGTVIRVLDLKKAIIEKKKLNKGLDFDLVITDAQNGKVYDDENMQLPRNTSVTVKRIPSQQPGSGLLARMKAEAAAAAAAAVPVLVAQQSPVMPPMGVPMTVPSAPLNAAMANASLNPTMVRVLFCKYDVYVLIVLIGCGCVYVHVYMYFDVVFLLVERRTCWRPDNGG